MGRQLAGRARRGVAPVLGASAVAKAGGAVAAAPAGAYGGPFFSYNYAYELTDINGGYDSFQLNTPGQDLAPPSPCPSNYFSVIDEWVGPVGSGNYGTNDLGGCVKAYDAGRNQDGRLELFGLKPGGSVGHIWQTQPASGPWSSWASLGSAGGGFTDGPTVKSGSSGALSVWAEDGNGNPWVDQQTSPGCCWSGWERVQ